MMRVLRLFILVTIGACAHQAGPRPESPALGGQAGLPADTWVEVYFDTFDSVTVAAGLQPLREGALPDGGREVRIWIGGGLGYPQRLYRFTEGNGRVQGQQIRYWPAEDEDSTFSGRRGRTFHDLMLRGQKGACGDFRRNANMGVCRTLFAREPDWPGVLRQAEQAGLWELPDESVLPGDGVLILDGWGITVELRRGSEYRAYRYGNPDRGSSPEAAKALAVSRALGGIDAVARPPDEVRLFRGVTSGTYRSAFLPCTGKSSWEFRGSLPHLARRSGLAVPDSARETLHYVEVVGVLSPEWLAEEWESPFPRVLQIYYLVRTSRWTGAECGRPRRRTG